MKTLKSIVAALMTAVMVVCLSVSSFAVYDEIVYDDVDEMYGTTMSQPMTLQIKFVDSLGIISRDLSGSFHPSTLVSRGDALKIAYRMLHYTYDELSEYESVSSDFDEMAGGDIADIDLLRPYIAWAEDYGLISAEGVPEQKFLRNQPITGEEFITLITKVLMLSVPTDYEEAMETILSDVEVTADSATINREEAAVIVANAMIYDHEIGSIEEDHFISFVDFDGSPLNCLATIVYGCRSTDLVVRATRQSPMGYKNITHDVLLSNGVEVDVGMDMSAFIGYPITVVYLDADKSGTYTVDEKFLTYELTSPFSTTVSLSNMTVSSYTGISGVSVTGAFTIYSNTPLYLNGEPWPVSELYQLTDLVDFVNFTTPSSITNRPNLQFTVLQTSSAENVDIALATEWIPGKVMTVTDSYFSLYSYYDSQVHTYYDNDVVFLKVSNLKSGDYVNFYENHNRLYVTEGTTALLNSYSESTEKGVTTLAGKATGEEEDTTYGRHMFYSQAARPISSLSGPIVAVLDTTRKTYIALEEATRRDDYAVEIISVRQSGSNATIRARDLVTNEELNLTVATNRITSATGRMEDGMWFTVSETQGGNINMYGIDRLSMDVIETDDYFIVAGNQKYLKTEGFTSDSTTPYSGRVTLMLDRYNGVWAVFGA